MLRKFSKTQLTMFVPFVITLCIILILQAATALATPVYIRGTYSSSYPQVVTGNDVTGKVYLGRVGDFPTGDIMVIDDPTGNVEATLAIPLQPRAIAVNQVTNKLYAVPWAPTDKMYIVDGSTNTPSEVVASSADFYRMDVAVNPATNKVYLAGYMWRSGPTIYLSVFDGSTLTYTTPTIDLGSGNNWEPKAAVMTGTNRIYVTAQDAVKVVSGSTDSVISTIPVGIYPKDIVANTDHNRLYVVNRDSNNVSVIDGSSDTVIATITVGTAPAAIAQNPLTNKLYVANSGDGTVSVVDGTSNTISATVAVSGAPSVIEVDTALNRVYVGTGARLKVIDGSTNAVYEPDLVYQPGHTYYSLQDLSVMSSHKVYLADRHNYDNYGWWYTIADIDLVASTVEAVPNFLPVDGPSKSSITVTLKDSLGVPVSGAAVWTTASGGENTITGSGAKTSLNGQVTSQLWSSKSEQKIVTATFSEGKSLANTALVTFTSPPPTSTVVGESTAGSTTYTDANGLTTTVEVPAGAVALTTVIKYTPMQAPTSQFPDFVFAGHAFSLTAYRNGAVVPSLDFQTPIIITVHYNDTDVQGLEENSLTLRHWDGNTWSSSGILIIERDAADNRLVASSTHLSDFALFAQARQGGRKLYLPLIQK